MSDTARDPRQGTLLLAPLVWFALIGTIAVLASPDPPEADPEATAFVDRSVVVVGDSLTVGAENQIRAVMAGADLEIDAISGRPLDRGSDIDGVDAIETAAAAVPEVLVIALGTNDGGEDDEYAAQVADALDDVDPSTCVVWMLPQDRLPGGTSLSFVEDEVAAAAASHPDLHLADWDAHLDGNEEDWHQGDGVHLTLEGNWGFARLMADTVMGSCL